MKKDEVRESRADASQRYRERAEQFVESGTVADAMGRAPGHPRTGTGALEPAEEDDLPPDVEEDRLFLDEDEAKAELPR